MPPGSHVLAASADALRPAAAPGRAPSAASAETYECRHSPSLEDASDASEQTGPGRSSRPMVTALLESAPPGARREPRAQRRRRSVGSTSGYFLRDIAHERDFTTPDAGLRFAAAYAHLRARHALGVSAVPKNTPLNTPHFQHAI